MEFDTLQDMLPLQFGMQPLNYRGVLSPLCIANDEVLKMTSREGHHNIASIIIACGDFQIAYKETWYVIRGFEECMRKRGFSDTVTQYKIIKYGGTVHAYNYPPIYNIQHERNNSAPVLNDKEYLPDRSTNHENWGNYLE